MLGTALALRSAQAGWSVALSAASAPAGFALAAADEVQRAALRAGAEAIEALEDFAAEAGSPEVQGGKAGRPEAGSDVIAGRARGGAAAGVPAPLVAAMHCTDRRLRLQCLFPPRADRFGQLAETLMGFPGVRSVVVRGRTGSILIGTAAGAAPALAERLARAGLVVLTPLGVPHPAALGMRLSLARTDAALRLRSGGDAGLGNLLGRLMGLGWARQSQQRGAGR